MTQKACIGEGTQVQCTGTPQRMLLDANGWNVLVLLSDGSSTLTPRNGLGASAKEVHTSHAPPDLRGYPVTHQGPTDHALPAEPLLSAVSAAPPPRTTNSRRFRQDAGCMMLPPGSGLCPEAPALSPAKHPSSGSNGWVEAQPSNSSILPGSRITPSLRPTPAPYSPAARASCPGMMMQPTGSGNAAAGDASVPAARSLMHVLSGLSPDPAALPPGSAANLQEVSAHLPPVRVQVRGCRTGVATAAGDGTDVYDDGRVGGVGGSPAEHRRSSLTSGLLREDCNLRRASASCNGVPTSVGVVEPVSSCIVPSTRDSGWKGLSRLRLSLHDGRRQHLEADCSGSGQSYSSRRPSELQLHDRAEPAPSFMDFIIANRPNKGGASPRAAPEVARAQGICRQGSLPKHSTPSSGAPGGQLDDNDDDEEAAVGGWAPAARSSAPGFCMLVHGTDSGGAAFGGSNKHLAMALFAAKSPRSPRQHALLPRTDQGAVSGSATAATSAVAAGGGEQPPRRQRVRQTAVL